MPSRRRNKSGAIGRGDISRLTPLNPQSGGRSSRNSRSRNAGGGGGGAVAHTGDTAASDAAAVPPSTAASSTRTRSASERPLCRFFVLNGNCRYGDDCAFSHALPDGGISEARRQVPCPFFARGSCKYGEFCQLRHDDDGRGLKSREDQHRTENTASAKDGGGDSALATCGICLEDTAKTQRKFGLLSCCPHAFCFDCLMEWRKEGSSEAEDRRSCPTCRKHSDYVVPSVTFAVGEEKERIVTEYKARLSVIPCKNFDGALGSCPFGKDCFYAHLGDGGEDVKSQDGSMEDLREEYMARRRRRLQRQGNDVEMLNSFLLLLDLYASTGFQGLWDDEDYDDSSSYPLVD